MTDRDLIYAATSRCRCGAGLAHPMDHVLALKLAAWVCSASLKAGGQLTGEHDSFPFAFYKVREETSINNTGGQTTRPPGTAAFTVGKAKCPECGETWASTPYAACGLSHHWFAGACPKCGYAVGGNGTHSSSDGPAIETRFADVILATEGVLT